MLGRYKVQTARCACRWVERQIFSERWHGNTKDTDLKFLDRKWEINRETAAPEYWDGNTGDNRHNTCLLFCLLPVAGQKYPETPPHFHDVNSTFNSWTAERQLAECSRDFFIFLFVYLELFFLFLYFFNLLV
jgi:hypothetical protein